MTCQNTNQPWVKTTQFPLKNWNLDLSYVRDIRATSEDDKSTERKLKWELHSSSDGYHMRTPSSPILQASAVHQDLTPLHIMSQHLSSGCKDVCTCAVPVSSDTLVSDLLGCSQTTRRCSSLCNFDFYIEMDSNFIHICRISFSNCVSFVYTALSENKK